jgi:hypothetical protein
LTDEPQLPPKLLAKLADFEFLADVLSRPIPESPRVEPEQLEDIQPYEDDDKFSDRWTPERVDGRALYQLRIQSPTAQFGRYIFLASDTWDAVAVPLRMLPPEYLGDPILKRWHWWTGDGAERVKDEASAIEFATAFVRKFHGLKPSFQMPNYRIHAFDVRTERSVRQFMTMEGWRGLWCLTEEAPKGLEPEQLNVLWTRLLTTNEIQGEKAIRRCAERYAKKFDKIKNRKPNVKPRNKRTAHYFTDESHEKLEHTRRFLEAIDPLGCSASKAIRWLIDEGFKNVPPEGEWKRRRRRKKKGDSGS